MALSLRPSFPRKRGSRGRNEKLIRIAVLKTPPASPISDDLDPLRAEADVQLDFIAPGQAIPGNADLVIIPGSKATIADLAALRATGLGHRPGRASPPRGPYPRYLRRLSDAGRQRRRSRRRRGPAETVPGLGLLDVATVMEAEKNAASRDRHGVGPAHRRLRNAYGPHRWRRCDTTDANARRPPRRRPSRVTGLVMGCTVHGLFRIRRLPPRLPRHAAPRPRFRRSITRR